MTAQLTQNEQLARRSLRSMTFSKAFDAPMRRCEPRVALPRPNGILNIPTSSGLTHLPFRTCHLRMRQPQVVYYTTYPPTSAPVFYTG
uniref:Uncharacterized protein n=1 Tax=Plectus sambesii TaxID=2011161 RepID=A0A914XDL0_9BILA